MLDYGVSSRTFSVPTNSTGDTVDLHIQVDAVKAENLSLKTWGSSVILANQLHHIKIDPASLQMTAISSRNQSINVLELGAGTGLVGLAAAVIWRTKVVLTDLAPIVPGLATNICVNSELLSSTGGCVSCGSLDWAHPERLQLSQTGAEQRDQSLLVETNKANVIIAADTIYSEEHPALLSKAILTWLKRSPDARVLIAYPLRVAYLEELRELWERLKEGGLDAFEEGKEDIGSSEDWDDETLHEWSVWRWHTEDSKQLPLK